MISTATQVRRLREKYGQGICGENYLQTGIPQINKERFEAYEAEAKRISANLTKVTKKAERAALKAYKKKTGKKLPPADQIVFC